MLYDNENEKILHELVRKAHSMIQSKDEELKWMTQRKNREHLFKRFPWCFASTKGTGMDTLTYPVCNRAGAIDPDIIKLSLAIAQDNVRNGTEDKMSSHEVLFAKLKRLNSRFSKDRVRDPKMAHQKGKVTKTMNFINNYLDSLTRKG